MSMGETCAAPTRIDRGTGHASAGGNNEMMGLDHSGDVAGAAAPQAAVPWARVRQTFALGTLVLAPLAGLAWSIGVQPFTTGMSGEVAFIATHQTRCMTATLLGVLMSCLMIPASVAIARVVRAKAPVAADIGMVLFSVGAFYHGAMLGFSLTEAPL